MMRRALRDNGAAVVSMAGISSAFLLLGRMVTVMLSLEAKVRALSVLWATLYLLQRVLVGKRRTSGHWLVQYTAWAAYYLPAPLVFYAANAVYYSSTSNINDSIPLLVDFILVMFILTIPFSFRFEALFTNMRAYSIRERAPRGRLNFLMCLIVLGRLYWGFSSPNKPVVRLVVDMVIHFIMFILAFLFAIATSESTMDCETKVVADYMKQLKSSESSTSSPFFDDGDANSNSSLRLMDCCRYPFLHGKYGGWVTVKYLVQRDDLLNEDKDICLSYSLCRLLARRYYGFPCAEEGDDMVRCFALANLGRRDGYKRAFTIVEVQLAFLHDYFFTASLQIMQSDNYIITAQIFTVVFQCIILLLVSFFTVSLHLKEQLGMIGKIAITGFWCVLFGGTVGGIPPMSSLLVQNLLASYWRPIHTAFREWWWLPMDRAPTVIGLARQVLFRSNPNPNNHDVFNPFQTQTSSAYWSNKIGQYSILQDYDRRPSRKKALVAWFQGTMLSQPSYKFIKHLPVEEEEVDMKKLDSVRELVANTLRAIDGPPTNGTRSLKINMDKINSDDSPGYDWLWTCKQATHTHTILIWHIATCYCDMAPISDDLLANWHHEAARALSRYCAYLVAFLPEFLPEHSLSTKQVFQRVLKEARRALGTEPMKEEEKRIKIQGLQPPDPDQHEPWRTFLKGVYLGRQLEMLSDDSLRWKVMAEFWAETILYVAPSENAEAHIEHLANGGEFITHLWAMLSNAGILKRAEGEWHPPPVVTATEEEPPTHQEIEAMSSSNDGPSTSSRPSPPIQTSEPPPNEKGKQLQMMEDID